MLCIGGKEALELDHRTGRAQLRLLAIACRGDLDGGPFQPRRLHLAGDAALPDQIVKLELLVRQRAANVVRRAVEGGVFGKMGGFAEDEALEVVAAIDKLAIDLIDISGGTYFPGAVSSSDRAGSGPYFLEFATRARAKTRIPLMVTGGFKTSVQAESAISEGKADLVGLARALVVEPELPAFWLASQHLEPQFPSFKNPPEGGVTAWYTMQITRHSKGESALSPDDLNDAIEAYENRDEARRRIWNLKFN